MQTVKSIIQDCVQQALQLPRDPIQTDIRDLALSVYNEKGREIWDLWPWKNEKMDEFTAPTPDASGIITFAATVDVIRAIRGYSSGSSTGTRIFNADELIAAANGEDVPSDRFVHLADSSTGCRRIQLNDDDVTTNSYSALCLKRWVYATVESTYSENNPSATPTDYRYMWMPIDGAEPALREYMKDALRDWADRAPKGLGDTLLNVALKRERLDNDVERRVNPRYPAYSDVGSWAD